MPLRLFRPLLESGSFGLECTGQKGALCGLCGL